MWQVFSFLDQTYYLFPIQKFDNTNARIASWSQASSFIFLYRNANGPLVSQWAMYHPLLNGGKLYSTTIVRAFSIVFHVFLCLFSFYTYIYIYHIMYSRTKVWQGCAAAGRTRRWSPGRCGEAMQPDASSALRRRKGRGNWLRRREWVVWWVWSLG